MEYTPAFDAAAWAGRLFTLCLVQGALVVAVANYTLRFFRKVSS